MADSKRAKYNSSTDLGYGVARPKDIYPYPLWHGFIFGFVGVVLVVTASIDGIKTLLFVRSAEITVGKIIALEPGTKRTMTPTFSFETKDHSEITIKSTTGTSPTPFHVGQEIEILFLASDPQIAKINHWSQLWMSSAFLFPFGMVFAIIGFHRQFSNVLDNFRRKRFSETGKSIPTQFERVEKSTLGVGRPSVNPFVIVSSFHDFQSGKRLEFKSRALWFDPSPFLENRAIKVLIKPNNPKRYWMDLSFLPKPESR